MFRINVSYQNRSGPSLSQEARQSQIARINVDELDKGLNISLTGAEAEAALAACRRQIEEWGVALPRVEPLVLDFGLGQFDRTGLIEYWIANEAMAGYCGKYMFLFDGQQCPAHAHRVKHETFFLMHGRLKVVLNDEPLAMAPGDVLSLQPGQVHSFQGDGNSLLLELSMPCEVNDNRFEDPRIMDWLARHS